MSKLIIIRGNSGSGKTSVARILQKKFGRNTMILSQDVIRREMLWVRDGEGNQAIPLLIHLLQYGKIHSDIVILEGILKSTWYMPLFEAALKEFQTEIFAYYYELPFEETLARHATRGQRNEFGESEMRDWWNEKDYIGMITEKTLTKEYTLQDAVDVIYRDVMNG